MKIGACYIRVSTADQTEYSPESQLRMIKDYASKNSIVLPDEYIFRDEGISGRTAEKRPAFQKMISTAKQAPRPFELILVYSTSRFARNHEQSIVYRSMLERECGVEVVSITQPNVDKKTDMLTNAIYSIIDEWYSLDLADNVKRGMTEKALQGGYQTQAPLGYELKHKGAVLTIKREEAQIIRFIFEQYLKGKTKWAIARSLKTMNAKTKKGCDIATRNITYILRNPVYKGYSRWTPTNRVYWDFKNKDTIITKGQHEPIIASEMFDAVQEKLDQLEAITKTKARPLETTKHWLSGLMKCGNCGQSLNFSGVTSTRKQPCFRCGGYTRGTCTTINYMTLATAEKNVLDYLAKLSEDINAIYEITINRTTNFTNEVTGLKNEIKKLKGKLDRAKQGFLNGVFELEEFKSMRQSYENEIDTCDTKIQELNNTAVDYIPFQKDIANVYAILLNDNFTKNEKQMYIRSVIEKIVVDRKSNEFRIYFFR